MTNKIMTNKPTVYYNSSTEPSLGYSCHLYEVTGHPKLGNKGWVITSKVISYNKKDGTIETLNTIYKKQPSEPKKCNCIKECC